jgi:hypothetical protein
MGKEGEGKSEWASWCGWGSRPGVLGFKRNMPEWGRNRRGRERERNFLFLFPNQFSKFTFKRFLNPFSI